MDFYNFIIAAVPFFSAAISLLSVGIAIWSRKSAKKSEEIILNANINNEKCKNIINLCKELYVEDINDLIWSKNSDVRKISDNAFPKIRIRCKNYIDSYNTNKIFLDSEHKKFIDNKINRVKEIIEDLKHYVESTDMRPNAVTLQQYPEQITNIFLEIKDSLYEQLDVYYGNITKDK